MKKFIGLVLFFPLVLNAATIYKVEVIVFSHLTAQAYDSEVWPVAPELPDMGKARALAPAQNPVTIYQSLPNTYYGMGRDIAALRKARSYPVLAHFVWLQPAGAPRSSHRVRVYGGATYDTAGNVVESSAARYWQLDGFVRVSRPYTFQVDTSLVLTLPKAVMGSLTNKTLDAPVYQFVLTQSEHPKLKEIYYFDHPLFGMLLQITAVKK